MFNFLSQAGVHPLASVFVVQLVAFLFFIVVLFLLFEIIPILFGFGSTIKKNFHDFFLYQVLTGIYGTLLFTLLFVGAIYFKINSGWVDISHFSLFSQVLILYICADFCIYGAHLLAHKYDIPILSKAHGFHHTVKEDMQWVNSRKEHLFVISLFVIIFSIFFNIVFRTSVEARPIVMGLFLLFNSLSHFRIFFSINLLDRIFLFPKDHLRHHTDNSGPYGVTLSLFDTIFDTRDEPRSETKGVRA